MTAAARLPADLDTALATIPFAIAAAIITYGTIASLGAGRRAGAVFATYLGLGLEFFLAAGLIRLAGAETFEMLALAGAIIVTRRILVLGLRFATRAAR